MSEDLDLNRLRNWARAYQRLMLGGMSAEAHTACVDDFADDEGAFPHITATDVLGLIERVECAEGVVARCMALLADGPDMWTPYDSRDTGETFLTESVLDFTADLRAALGLGEVAGSAQTGSQAVRSALGGSDGPSGASGSGANRGDGA